MLVKVLPVRLNSSFQIPYNLEQVFTLILKDMPFGRLYFANMIAISFPVAPAFCRQLKSIVHPTSFECFSTFFAASTSSVRKMMLCNSKTPTPTTFWLQNLRDLETSNFKCIQLPETMRETQVCCSFKSAWGGLY